MGSHMVSHSIFKGNVIPHGAKIFYQQNRMQSLLMQKLQKNLQLFI